MHPSFLNLRSGSLRAERKKKERLIAGQSYLCSVPTRWTHFTIIFCFISILIPGLTRFRSHCLRCHATLYTLFCCVASQITAQLIHIFPRLFSMGFMVIITHIMIQQMNGNVRSPDAAGTEITLKTVACAGQGVFISYTSCSFFNFRFTRNVSKRDNGSGCAPLQPFFRETRSKTKIH